jgi:hypothetical protein
MAAKGIYIYGIVPNFYSTDMFRSLDNSEVYAIPFRNISAIVSDRENVGLENLDRESLGYLLVHHQKTIEELQSKEFNMLIPMRLGTIVNSKEDVLRILTNGYELIVNVLKKIEFLTEIDIAVTWADFPETLKAIAMHPDIVALKENLMKNIGNLSQLDQVKVGMLMQEKLEQRNKAVELRILDVLSPYTTDIKIHDVMNDQMISNSAFLMNRNVKDKFEQAIDKLDEEFGGLLNFKLVGPLPCYSFFTMEIEALNPEHIAQAKDLLGLHDETSEAKIKKAYLEKAKEFHPDAQQHHDDDDNFTKVNKAYHTMLNYLNAARQTSKEDVIVLTNEKVIENLVLVKIKD